MGFNWGAFAGGFADKLDVQAVGNAIGYYTNGDAATDKKIGEFTNMTKEDALKAMGADSDLSEGENLAMMGYSGGDMRPSDTAKANPAKAEAAADKLEAADKLPTEAEQTTANALAQLGKGASQSAAQNTAHAARLKAAQQDASFNPTKAKSVNLNSTSKVATAEAVDVPKKAAMVTNKTGTTGAANPTQAQPVQPTKPGVQVGTAPVQPVQRGQVPPKVQPAQNLQAQVPAQGGTAQAPQVQPTVANAQGTPTGAKPTAQQGVQPTVAAQQGVQPQAQDAATQVAQAQAQEQAQGGQAINQPVVQGAQQGGASGSIVNLVGAQGGAQGGAAPVAGASGGAVQGGAGAGVAAQGDTASSNIIPNFGNSELGRSLAASGDDASYADAQVSLAREYLIANERYKQAARKGDAQAQQYWRNAAMRMRSGFTTCRLMEKARGGDRNAINQLLYNMSVYVGDGSQLVMKEDGLVYRQLRNGDLQGPVSITAPDLERATSNIIRGDLLRRMGIGPDDYEKSVALRDESMRKNETHRAALDQAKFNNAATEALYKEGIFGKGSKSSTSTSSDAADTQPYIKHTTVTDEMGNTRNLVVSNDKHNKGQPIGEYDDKTGRRFPLGYTMATAKELEAKLKAAGYTGELHTDVSPQTGMIEWVVQDSPNLYSYIRVTPDGKIQRIGSPFNPNQTTAIQRPSVKVDWDRSGILGGQEYGKKRGNVFDGTAKPGASGGRTTAKATSGNKATKGAASGAKKTAATEAPKAETKPATTPTDKAAPPDADARSRGQLPADFDEYGAYDGSDDAVYSTPEGAKSIGDAYRFAQRRARSTGREGEALSGVYKPVIAGLSYQEAKALDAKFTERRRRGGTGLVERLPNGKEVGWIDLRRALDAYERKGVDPMAEVIYRTTPKSAYEPTATSNEAAVARKSAINYPNPYDFDESGGYEADDTDYMKPTAAIKYRPSKRKASN